MASSVFILATIVLLNFTVKMGEYPTDFSPSVVTICCGSYFASVPYATYVMEHYFPISDTQTITVVGPISANIDDATSSAACPSGYVLSACRPDVGKSKCDGTIITTTGQCIAWSSGVKAVKVIF